MNLITLMLSIMLVLLSTFISSNLPTSLGYERFLPLFAARFLAPCCLLSVPLFLTPCRSLSVSKFLSHRSLMMSLFFALPALVSAQVDPQPPAVESSNLFRFDPIKNIPLLTERNWSEWSWGATAAFTSVCAIASTVVLFHQQKSSDL